MGCSFVPRFRLCRHEMSCGQRRTAGLSMDLSGQGIYDPTTMPESVRVVVFGSTGYIGRYVTKEFIKRGYDVRAFARSKSGVNGRKKEEDVREDFEGAEVGEWDQENTPRTSQSFW